MKRNSNIIYGLIIAFLFAGCSKGIVFDDSVRVATPTWNCDSTVCFKVNIEDTLKDYQTAILIRNSGQYSYQNLWIFVSEIAPDSTIRTDTLQCFLADDYGRWIGSGIGSLYTNLFLYQDSVRFRQKGEYRYEITHGMRVEELDGINDIGLKVLERE